MLCWSNCICVVHAGSIDDSGKAGLFQLIILFEILYTWELNVNVSICWSKNLTCSIWESTLDIVDPRFNTCKIMKAFVELRGGSYNIWSHQARLQHQSINVEWHKLTVYWYISVFSIHAIGHAIYALFNRYPWYIKPRNIPKDRQRNRQYRQRNRHSGRQHMDEMEWRRERVVLAYDAWMII